MDKNIIYDNIISRTSVRSYTDQPVEQEKIDLLLHAAMAAPSACNKQPWHFVVINDRKILDKIPSFSPYASMVREAPLAIVVCGDLSKAMEEWERQFWVQDCSAATENILLMAHGLGLGAVWTALYPAKDRFLGMQQLLDLSEDIIPLNTIVIGYPKGETNPKDKWKEENVSYNGYRRQ